VGACAGAVGDGADRRQCAEGWAANAEDGVLNRYCDLQILCFSRDYTGKGNNSTKEIAQ
jgi:hypothetical protein